MKWIWKFDKRILNIIIIVFLSIATFWWTFQIFHRPIVWPVVFFVIFVRIVASILLFKDYSLSWSKATPKTFLIKSVVYAFAFAVYMPFLYRKIHIGFMLSELAFFLFAINFFMYSYAYYINTRNRTKKTKSVVIYGAGKAGLRLEEELQNSEYKVRYFIDDDPILHKRSVDGIPIISKERAKIDLQNNPANLLLIAVPSASQSAIRSIYEEMQPFFASVKILPAIDDILKNKPFTTQLRDISVADLLARHPKDLDKKTIFRFIKDRTVLITGAGGSIGSELVRQCVKYGAKKLILLDHSEYNLYKIEQELTKSPIPFVCVMQSVVDKERLTKTFRNHRPHIVLHAAAYKHVPLCEENEEEAILNNIIGTKNCIDLAIEFDVKKFVLISTDKAVRPTNIMGATKRVCELYAQNKPSKNTEIVTVRFGNVLGSSGSVIPKFKEQIEKGGPVTVTHPEVTRYFMLIPEACELVLQAGAIGKGGEIFILDMGKPIKIVDLAKKMIELSGKKDIQIEFVGLRPGEKLHEELLIDENSAQTHYESITIATPSYYDIHKLELEINQLLNNSNPRNFLHKLVPEFQPDKSS